MPSEEKFDFPAFVSTMKALSHEDRQNRLREEMERASALVIRDPSRQFQQQLYLQRLKRLSRFLSGENVIDELTPVEAQAYVLIAGSVPPRPAAAAAAAPAAPPAAIAAAARAAAEAPPEPVGAERRTSRRIAMKTWARIRRESDSEIEVVEPANVSRGGLSFQSIRPYDLHEIIWVDMHHDPGREGAEMEVRSLIVRAVPLRQWDAFSYGVKFL